MKKVSIWNPKGGQGKSMLAINLAAAAIDIGLEPLVICQDKQGTSTLFHKNGNLNFEVVQEIPRHKPKGIDLVLIDHMAADWSAPPCSTVVIPTKPVRSDYATFCDALQILKKAQKRTIKVVTDGNVSRKTEADTVAALKKIGVFEIRSSVAFPKAAEEYRSIFDKSLNRVNKIKSRRMEVNAILTAILNEEECT